jgi:hypothetical protein
MAQDVLHGLSEAELDPRSQRRDQLGKRGLSAIELLRKAEPIRDADPDPLINASRRLVGC